MQHRFSQSPHGCQVNI